MKKKRMDQMGAAGIWDTAFGYAMKARPGPATDIFLNKLSTFLLSRKQTTVHAINRPVSHLY